MSECMLRLEDISKDFGEGFVLRHIDLEVQKGEFLTLLGPSGCGKTTTLRIIAGLETPSAGRVYLDEKDVSSLPPEKREVNTVFQNYALFPHMNVYQNIAYGMKLRGVPKAMQQSRVSEALQMVRLEGYEKRKPSQLSGGQRQRVAIARSIVLQPKVLLLDEPLGALDLKLRREMQKELKQLQQQLGITFVYITHDQEEALNMSTRIVIMRDGQIEQIGTPEEIYEYPATLFAADFIGQSNFLKGTASEVDGNKITVNCGSIVIPAASRSFLPQKGEDVILCIRPQRIRYASSPEDFDWSVKGIIMEKEYTGGIQHTAIRLENGSCIQAALQSSELDSVSLGSEVFVTWDIFHAPLIPDQKEKLQ